MEETIEREEPARATKEYMGDGVYAEVRDGWDIRVTAENGICATNEIFLDPTVLEKLVSYAKRHGFLHHNS